MSDKGSESYFDVNDPIKDYFKNLTGDVLLEFSTFITDISEAEMMDYLNRAFDVALEQIKVIGPQIINAAPDLDATVKREMLEELFEKQKWKVSRQMILDDFLKSQD
jgi:hypothetical protein